MKRKYYLLIIILLIAVICGYFYFTKSTKKSEVGIKFTNDPTFFFHGGGSNYHAEDKMVNAAINSGVTKTVIIANVDKDGKVTLSGKIPQNAKNPIVKVNYEDNRQTDFNKAGEYATNVVKAVRKKFNFSKMNMVGHSLGNISIIYYMLQNDTDPKMPKLVKQVDIAGHFAGLDFSGVPESIKAPSNLKVDSNGMPNKMNSSYRQMTGLRNTYPKDQVAVLNIVGNIGNKTDGTVSNASSESLRYLVADRAKSYQEKIINGSNAQHSKLHDNSEVNKLLIKFLWK